MKVTNKTILVCDWNPNGTNDIMLVDNNEVQRFGLDEVTFGINISDYDAFEIEPDCYVAEVPLKDVIAKLAVSPVRTQAESYKRLMSYINGGAK